MPAPYRELRTDRDVYEQVDVRYKKQAGGKPSHLFINNPAEIVLSGVSHRIEGQEGIDFARTTWFPQS